MISEKNVEQSVRKYLISKGWKLTNEPKLAGIHGIDIKGYHPKWRKVILIEAKGDGKAKAQTIHNAFYTVLGQVLSRMDKRGNHTKSARIYAIAIPAHWENVFRNKIKKMAFGWSLLKIRVFLVDENLVEEKSYSYFMKSSKITNKVE